jgi:DNA-binding IclR family transcriptional regulator
MADEHSRETEEGLSRYHVPNLERALEVLETLAQQRGGMTAAELVEALEVPKNSVFRITMTLLNRGYLRRDEVTKRFSLSQKLISLGYAAVAVPELREVALEVMRSLRDRTRETVLLGTLVEDQGVVLEQIASPEPVKFLVDAGTRFPIHTSAPGKVILAFLPDDEREAIIQRLNLTRFNDRTITTQQLFRDELQRARSAGYAVDRGEEMDGVHCLSAPILDYHGTPVAAVWVTGPSFRLKESQFPSLAEVLIDHARQISSRLGFSVTEQ